MGSNPLQNLRTFPTSPKVFEAKPEEPGFWSLNLMDLLWHFGMSRFFQFITHHLSAGLDGQPPVHQVQAVLLDLASCKAVTKLHPQTLGWSLKFTMCKKGHVFTTPKRSRAIAELPGSFLNVIKSKSQKIWPPNVRGSACWKLNSLEVAVFFGWEEHPPWNQRFPPEKMEKIPKERLFVFQPSKKSGAMVC